MFHTRLCRNTGNRAAADASAAPNDSPRWQLSEIYTGIDSVEYHADKVAFSELIVSFETQCKSLSTATPFRAWLIETLQLLNKITALSGTLNSFVYCCFSVDTANEIYIKELNSLESIAIPLPGVLARMRAVLESQSLQLTALSLSTDPELSEYSWLLEEMVFLAHHQMSPSEEDLAADLTRSGSEAFTRLQESLSASLSRPWHDATTKTIVELRGLAHHADRQIREKAWNLELSAWEEHKLAFAASLNGVKGSAVTLAKRRGWKSNLEQSIVQSRISSATLDSLIASMKTSLPDFRRYMHAKAKLLGLKHLSFFDLFAPLKGLESKWTFTQARDFIGERFASFSPDLASFAHMAFDKGWIDAQPRPGKIGGAYCIDFPLRGQTRIMSNFTGNFDSIITIAHELGHAWHSWLLSDKAPILREYPMTLAETASLFCETLVYKDELARVTGAQRLALLEMRLSDINQIITDILSRFLFESEVFARRQHSELSAEEFCAIMRNAQQETYSDGLNFEQLHPYMWAVKGHYYHAGLNYYNYPYAFGQLFGLGLYAHYQNKPEGFAERYQDLLKQTGQRGAVELCQSAGMDIESESFWNQALAQVRTDIDIFCDLAETTITTSGGSR